ncbi:MAG: SAM-dependent methyltransferase [Bacteroidales bacterium]|nr:SAM-dependent methyltransferase [Bacteroidales bacterium]
MRKSKNPEIFLTLRTMSGKLHLIPNRICEIGGEDGIPLEVKELIHELQYFVVENLRTVRRFIKSLDRDADIDSLQFLEMHKNISAQESMKALQWLRNGRDVGVISDAGLPGIADPGNQLVLQAHQDGIEVIPHAGPSSMLLGLIASGLNGQRFSFHGYLPVRHHDRNRAIRDIETKSKHEKSSHILMETPYRNVDFMKSLLQTLNPKTWLCVACDISAPQAYIRTLRIEQWRKTDKPDLHKRPAVFVIQGFDD